jgi:AcrR family transcriptional regulator
MAEGTQVQGRPRTTQEQRSQRTRTKLADAAIECLVEQGYRGTTFVEVCRRAGLTRGAAHHHYRDLPALLLDAMRRLNQGLLERARPVLRDGGDTEKRIDAALDVLWDVFNARDFKAVVEIWVAQSHDPDLRERLRSEMEDYANHLAEGLAASFPELMHADSDAVRMMQFAFLTMLGMGFAKATIYRADDPDQHDRMRSMLKKVVQREVSFIREHGPTAH